MSWLKKLVTPIDEAANRKDAQALRQAPRQPPSLDDWDEDGWTALLTAVRGQDLARVRELLENGANPNTPSRPKYRSDTMSYTTPRTPLYFAIRSSNPEILRLLILNGANIEDVEEGQPALAQAIRVGNESAVEILIEHGANVNAVANQQTMLQLVMQEMDCTVQLIQDVTHGFLVLPDYDCKAAVKFVERLQHFQKALMKAGAL
jgi:ankyrin repeat protein